MKKKSVYLFWIFLLASGLMLLILAAQFSSNRNINGLNTGNREAAITFTIKNRLQEIVNMSFILETGIIRKKNTNRNHQSLRDSLTVMGYNTSVLAKLNLDTATRDGFSRLKNFIDRQVVISLKTVDTLEAGDSIYHRKLADSLAGLKLSDSIYSAATLTGMLLEKKLQSTLSLNTGSSRKLSDINNAIALIAIAAILILGTIIINRHIKQVGLINELEKANAEVKKSAAVKEQFLANMSHEIRTPLNAIRGFSRLILQTPLDKKQFRFAEIIENSSRNLLSLVNDILDISKIEAGEMAVRNSWFDLREMLETIEAMFIPDVSAAGLTFSTRLEDSIPRKVKGDADRLQQILNNLVSNAIKFTKSGSVQVRVELEKDNSTVQWISFSVEDTGVGIAPEKREIIFERFQQVKDGSDNVQKGTGLGLAIVRELATLLGGSVHIKSEKNKGSVFTVVLPFEKINSEKSRENFDDDNTACIKKWAGARILIAEDNTVNSLLISSMLRQYGINTRVCKNGEEAIEYLNHQSFDLLLLDLQMPRLNGYQTIKLIRNKKMTLPVVAMTAFVMQAEKERCFAAGMNGYLAKPIEENELLEVLKKFLQGKIPGNLAENKIETGESFLLQLSGGDEQMTRVIIQEIIKELPGEIEKLSEQIRLKDTKQLPDILHHLVSTISPLGNDTPAFQQLSQAQQALKENKENENIFTLVLQLKEELEKVVKKLSLSFL